MRILFFQPMLKLFYKRVTCPLGLMSIASYLNANGHNAVICERFFTDKTAEEILTENNPDIIGISIVANQYLQDSIEISAAAKKLGVPVVWGGPMASEIPEEALRSGVVDYISFNEGEETWLEMADALRDGKPFDDIKGLGYIKDGVFVETEKRPFIDLKKLPPLDWELIDPPKYFQQYYQSQKMLYMYRSKGCIGRCTFCYNPKYHCSTFRTRNEEYLFDEIEYLINKYGMDGVNFSDDLLFKTEQEAIDFSNEVLRRGLKFYWGGGLRVGIIKNTETFALMHKAGCRWFLIGVETGSPKVQKEIKKYFPAEKIKETFELCHNNGITVIASFMVGLPGETADDLRETVELAKGLKSTVLGFQHFTPIPGTEIFDQLVEEGKYTPLKTLEEHANTFFGEKFSFNVSEVSDKELKVIKNYFQMRALLFKSEFKDDTDKHLFAKIAKNAFIALSGHGILHFIKSFFFGLNDFLSAVGVVLHPKIRKKYNLYFFR